MFIAGVESGRIADGMAKKNEEKMKRRLEAAGEAAGDGDKELQPKKDKQPTRRRFHFQQNEVVKGSKDGAMAEDAKRVLGKIF